MVCVRRDPAGRDPDLDEVIHEHATMLSQLLFRSPEGTVGGPEWHKLPFSAIGAGSVEPQVATSPRATLLRRDAGCCEPPCRSHASIRNVPKHQTIGAESESSTLTSS
eukprot:5946610-Prymnesium_polylepis.1